MAERLNASLIRGFAGLDMYAELHVTCDSTVVQRRSVGRASLG
jgi:hypothetical protein